MRVPPVGLGVGVQLGGVGVCEGGVGVIRWVAVSVGKLRVALCEKEDVLVSEKDVVKVTVGWIVAVPVRLPVADVREELHVGVAGDWVTEHERVPEREKVRDGARVTELLGVGVEEGEACCVIVLGVRVGDGDRVPDRLPV